MHGIGLQLQQRGELIGRAIETVGPGTGRRVDQSAQSKRQAGGVRL